MGLDATGVLLLQMIQAKEANLGKVLTLGRQGVHIRAEQLRSLGVGVEEPIPSYCESILISDFGAMEVFSLDSSGYEGATLLADLNDDLSEFLHGDFDVVLNLGTLEHVFDVSAALWNITSAVRLGGIVAHVTPANQQAGHGFYQFSPELFHSYYSPERGFSETSVFVVPVTAPRRWYEVPRPQPGQRINIRSRSAIYVVCMTRKLRQADSGPIYQSDYVHTWNSTQDEVDTIPVNRTWIRSAAARLPGIRVAYQGLREARVVSRLVVDPVWSDLPLRRHDAMQLIEAMRAY